MTGAAAQPGAEVVSLAKNEGVGRYELRVDGVLVGLADYSERGDVVVIPHTETAPAFGGRGLASRLVRYALEDVRAAGKRVDPACPFVAAFIERNPEYADLLS